MAVPRSLYASPPPNNSTQGGIPLALAYLKCNCTVLCEALFVCLVPNFVICLSSHGQFVCLVDSFRYNGLATLALAAFGCVRALRARCRALRARSCCPSHLAITPD